MHPKSNGVAESTVKSVKNLLRKAAESECDPKSCTTQSWKTIENTDANDVITTSAKSDRHNIRQETSTSEEEQKLMLLQQWCERLSQQTTRRTIIMKSRLKSRS